MVLIRDHQIFMASQRLLQTACLALVFGSLCCTAKAADQFISLSSGGTMSIDGLMFTLTTCGYNQGNCSSLTDIDLKPVISSAGAEFEVMNTVGSSVLDSSASSSVNDLSFTLSVAPITSGSKTTVSTVSTSLIGDKSSSGVSPTVGITVSWLDGSGMTQETSGFGNIDAPAVANFSPQSNFNIAYDFKAKPGTTLTTTTTTFTPAPEPMSLALMVPACIGLHQVRQRKRKAQATRKS
jgi:hypothetical protein